MIGRLGRGQVVLRVLVLLGPVLALLTTALVGTPPAWWLIALVVVLAVAFAAMPDSPFGTAVMAVVLFWWGVSLRDGLHPQAILAAAGLVTAHVAAVVASYGPGTMPLDRAVVRLWVLRGGAVLLTAPAVWLVATLLRDQPEPAGIWVAGLVAACVATLVASAAFDVGGER